MGKRLILTLLLVGCTHFEEPEKDPIWICKSHNGNPDIAYFESNVFYSWLRGNGNLLALNNYDAKIYILDNAFYSDYQCYKINQNFKENYHGTL